MTPPHISVLMPVHNAERSLAQAMDNILRQTQPDFELIVVTDAARDGSPAMLADDAALTRAWWVENSTNQGLTRSLNTALARARGTLIARHDTDDFSMPERFECQAAFLDAHPDVGLWPAPFASSTRAAPRATPATLVSEWTTRRCNSNRCAFFHCA